MPRGSTRVLRWLAVIAVAAVATSPVLPVGAAGQRDRLAPPVILTPQQDRQRQMDILKITSFPPGPPSALASTYDEAAANPYPNLPDPLVMNDGTKVTTPAQWRQRRAELVEMFEREIYGRTPTVTPQVTWHVVSTTREMNGGVPVIVKQLLGTWTTRRTRSSR